ncbi:MAG TPA: response regulator [Terriglobales bacterium]|nr:response regulator [Terriglobales bacterium]
MARKILLADDSVTAQNMGRKILADAGYDVVTVNNGSAALKRIAESAPDLIILDVYMPGYSGLEVCQRLKEAEETANIPILLSVGKLEPFKPQEARRVRADAHIVKPFEASQLLTAIARLEDQMVPQQKGSHRFASSGASDDSYSESRILGRGAKSSGLRRREKEAAQADDGHISSQAAAFRDFRKKAKSAAGDESEASTVETTQKPTPRPDLPRDITPEELSALSEVAAKLNEAAPAPATAVAPEAPEPASIGTPVAEGSVEVAPSEAAVEAAPVAAVAEDSVPAFAPEPAAESSLTFESPAQYAEPVESPVALNTEVQIPVAQTEPSFEVASTAPVEPSLPEAETVETPKESEVPFPEPVSVASFAENAAPIDQEDEPMFASVHTEEVTESRVSATSVEEPPTISEEIKAEEAKQEESSSIDSSFAQPAFGEFTSESSADEFCAVEAPVSEPISIPAMAAATSAEESIEPEAPMPTDAELAEALRLLTPSTPHAEENAPMPVAAAPDWSTEDTMELPARPRWVAEAIQLTPEESALSLEAEMFRSFASNAEKSEPAAAEDPLAAIQAAVENRIAAEISAGEGNGEAAAKAMAAVAPAGNSTHVTDETEIASIVDKVMADLRPKIVEEIARKLAGK